VRRILLLTAVALSAAASCPNSVWCDYHSQYAFKVKDEYPSGKHYVVYSHGTGKFLHEIRQACE